MPSTFRRAPIRSEWVSPSQGYRGWCPFCGWGSMLFVNESLASDSLAVHLGESCEGDYDPEQQPGGYAGDCLDCTKHRHHTVRQHWKNVAEMAALPEITRELMVAGIDETNLEEAMVSVARTVQLVPCPGCGQPDTMPMVGSFRCGNCGAISTRLEFGGLDIGMIPSSAFGSPNDYAEFLRQFEEGIELDLSGWFRPNGVLPIEGVEWLGH